MSSQISLADARQAMKGDFRAIVITIGELQSGTSEKGDWTKKNITIEDKTARMSFAAWGDEIKLFELGETYDFVQPWFKEYNGDVTLAIGKYCKVTKAIGAPPREAPPPGQTTIETPKQTIFDPAPALTDFVYQENKALLEIEAIITEQHKQLGVPYNGQQIGMHTREIYLQAKKTNLLKASQIP